MAKCDSCLWSGMCETKGACEHYSPIDTEFEIETEEWRSEYYKAWREYVSDLDVPASHRVFRRLNMG